MPNFLRVVEFRLFIDLWPVEMFAEKDPSVRSLSLTPASLKSIFTVLSSLRSLVLNLRNSKSCLGML